MTQRTELRDVLASIRSKNAGPFAFTIDVFFKQETDWQAVVDQAVLSPDTVGALYTIEPERIRVHNFKPALAIKVATKRHIRRVRRGTATSSAVSSSCPCSASPSTGEEHLARRARPRLLVGDDGPVREPGARRPGR